MSGCYGNDPEDRYWESKLDDHLDSFQEELLCHGCGDEEHDCDCALDMEGYDGLL